MSDVIKGSNPDISMGQRPDGTSWVVGVSFGEGVGVDGYNKIWDNRKRITAEGARARAAALIAAADWVDSGRSAQIEAGEVDRHQT